MTMMPKHTQFEEQTMEADTVCGRLHFKITGRGEETIVLWPSIFTDHHIYDGLVEVLAARYRFVLIDGPGHGASSGTGSPYKTEDFGSAMLQVMDIAGVERAIVGGTSWGGISGAMATLQRPDRVSALLLMNTPMEIDEQRVSLSSRMITLGARWMPGTKLFRDGVAKSFFLPETRRADARYMTRFHEMLQRADSRELTNAVASVILKGSPLIYRLGEISVPALVIAGRQDDMYPLKAQAEAALALPDGYFEAVNSAHISVVDDRVAVAAAISGFLDKAGL